MRTAAWGVLAMAFVATVAAEGGVLAPVMWMAAVMAGAAAAFLMLKLLPSQRSGERQGR